MNLRSVWGIPKGREEKSLSPLIGLEIREMGEICIECLTTSCDE